MPIFRCPAGRQALPASKRFERATSGMPCQRSDKTRFDDDRRVIICIWPKPHSESGSRRIQETARSRLYQLGGSRAIG